MSTDCGHACCDERTDPLHDHFLRASDCPNCTRRLAACHIEHAVSFTGAPVGRDLPGAPFEPCTEVERAKAACKAARWPEHHRDDCAWCALVAEERRIREALLND